MQRPCNQMRRNDSPRDGGSIMAAGVNVEACDHVKETALHCRKYDKVDAMSELLIRNASLRLF